MLQITTVIFSLVVYLKAYVPYFSSGYFFIPYFSRLYTGIYLTCVFTLQIHSKDKKESLPTRFSIDFVEKKHKYRDKGRGKCLLHHKKAKPVKKHLSYKESFEKFFVFSLLCYWKNRTDLTTRKVAMFGIGTMEIMIILVVALIIIGPQKLPQMARTVGKAFGEFKRVTNDMKHTIDLEVKRAERAEQEKQAREELLLDNTVGDEDKDNDKEDTVEQTDTIDQSAKTIKNHD